MGIASSRFRKRLIFAVTILAVVGLALGYFIYYRPKQAVARYKAALIARGEKLGVQELLPAPVPRSENRAANCLKVAQLLRGANTLLETNRPEAMRMVAPGKAMIGWQRDNLFDPFAKTPTTNSWEELATALADDAEAFELLHELIEHPTVDWELDYAQGFSLLLPHLAPTKQAAQRLQVAELLALRNRRSSEAVRHLRAMLALVKASDDERLIISQLVRLANAQIAFAATWSAVQSPDLTDEQLASLQRDWAELDFATGLEHALEMERAMSNLTIERMRKSSAEFRKVSSGWAGGGGAPALSGDWLEQVETLASRGLEATRQKARESAWRISWSLADELTSLKGVQAMLDTTRAARSNGCYLAAISLQRKQLTQLGITNRESDDFNLFGNEPDLRTLFSDSIVSLSRTLDRVMVAETGRHLMVTGIALRRYQLREGRYPDGLAALVPGFLSEIPRDPADGKPLRYLSVGTNSFALYSIGKDGADDGGDAVNPTEKGPMSWQNGRDWVWPQPASEEEIAAWYEAQLKKLRR